MPEDQEKTGGVEALLDTPKLSDALESEQFRHFLDQVPIAIVVSEIKGGERIVYANPEFEKVAGQTAAEIEGKDWGVLRGRDERINIVRELGAAIVEASDRVGTFVIERAARENATVDVYSNIIENEDGVPTFRLAALVDVGTHGQAQRDEFALQAREKDVLLLEIQHRVKNNLQMITALIRMETRNIGKQADLASLSRLAGRIKSIQLLYELLLNPSQGDEIDLGIYLSEIVSSVMHAHATEGIRLDLKVDAYPVSVNVAMPTGLVVNELMTNALKHAFVGRNGGTITLHSLADSTGCRVTIADDGVGLPEGMTWPKRGKLGALIVRSLRENAKADLTVESSSGNGTRVTIVFTRAASAPEVTAG